jgi:hypothetical protein
MIRIIAILGVLTLFSCSSERLAQFHYKKALKHGLKVVQDSDTIRITTLDSFPVIKNDTIFWEKFIAYRDTVIKFNNVYVPKTRWQTRIEYKERIKTLRIQGKTQWKTAKAQQIVKYKFRWWWLIVAFCVGFLVRYILSPTFIGRIKLFMKLWR